MNSNAFARAACPPALVLIFTVLLAASEPTRKPANTADSATLERLASADAKIGRLFVYEDSDSEDNHGNWTNWMGPSNPAESISLALDDVTSPAFGKSAAKIRFKFIRPTNWAGIAVSTQPDYWGEVAGEGLDLNKATKLVVHLRGERGNEVVQIKAAIAGDKPFGDSAKIPLVSPWIKLTKEWQRVEIPIDQKRSNLTRTIIPLAIVSDRAHNSAEEITFFADQIYFVTGK